MVDWGVGKVRQRNGSHESDDKKSSGRDRRSASSSPLYSLRCSASCEGDERVVEIGSPAAEREGQGKKNRGHYPVALPFQLVKSLT